MKFEHYTPTKLDDKLPKIQIDALGFETKYEQRNVIQASGYKYYEPKWALKQKKTSKPYKNTKNEIK